MDRRFDSPRVPPYVYILVVEAEEMVTEVGMEEEEGTVVEVVEADLA